MNELIEVSWKALKSGMEAKKIVSRLQWLEEVGRYDVFLFDGPMRLKASIQITKPKNADQDDFERNYKGQTNKVLDPVDVDNSQLSRTKITQTGWAFQLHGVGIETGKLAGIHNKKINPGTLEITDLAWTSGQKFVSMKLYKEDRSLITEEADQGLAHYSVVDWAVDHEIEIVGANFTQNSRPANDIWMWVFGAPLIANIKFCEGGINLKRLGDGNEVNADGRAPKYLHPTEPIPGINRFRMVFYHPVYEAHPCQMVFQFFRGVG